jgi:hypothetical protein
VLILNVFDMKIETVGCVTDQTSSPPRFSYYFCSDTRDRCPIDMNGLNTKVDVNIIPLGSYDCLIGMDWSKKHHDILDYYNKTITCLDEEGKQCKIQGIPGVLAIREIPAMHLKKSFRKGCQMFAAHMEEAAKDKVASIEYHPILRYFEDVFREILGRPPKIDIDFSIDLV